jgi:protein tyrosine phosphatase
MCIHFIQGYKLRKGFIIAQSPMATTVKDFVKMLYERECGVVVMLCGCEEGGVEVCAQYWPATAGTMMKYGEFMVSTTSIDNTNNGFIQRDITIIDPRVRLSTQKNV